jgi:hypothetical protein
MPISSSLLLPSQGFRNASHPEGLENFLDPQAPEKLVKETTEAQRAELYEVPQSDSCYL